VLWPTRARDDLTCARRPIDFTLLQAALRCNPAQATAADCPYTPQRCAVLPSTMGKANKQKAKKLAKKRAKTLLKARDEDAMVIDDESAPAAPLTGRQKHAQKVAAKRALRAAKQDIQQQRWAIPKRSVDRKAERKQLVEQAKALRRENAADATDAPAPPDDAPMAEKPAFAYAVDAKKARKAAKRRAKERAREARYDGDVQKTP
jgi:hypothetical protein